MSYTKQDLLGRKVYDDQARCLGTVKDVAFTVGQDALSLIITKEKQTDQMLTWKSVQAVGEIIILKPPEVKPEPPPQPQAPVCPSCGQPLTWVPKYTRWYCTKEQKYA